MAQDFGDDMGNALLNFVTRQAENYLRFGRGRERAFDCLSRLHLMVPWITTGARPT